MSRLYAAGVDIEPVRLRRLRYVIGAHAYIVDVHPAKHPVEMQPVMSTLLTELGHHGDRGERRLLEGRIDRAVPFLTTAPLNDVVIRNAQMLSRAAAEDLALGCELAGKTLTFIIEPPLSAALNRWLGDNAYGCTVSDLLARLGAETPPWTPRRSVPPGASLVDLLDIAHEITGLAPTLPVCLSCRQPTSPAAQDVQTRLIEMSQRCSQDCTAHAATSLEAAKLLTSADAVKWVATLPDLHLRLSRYRDHLRPALVVLARVLRSRTPVLPPARETALIYAVQVGDVARDGATVRLGGEVVAVPAELRVYLRRQRLSASLSGRRHSDLFCAFGAENVARSALAGLLQNELVSLPDAPAGGQGGQSRPGRLPPQ